MRVGKSCCASPIHRDLTTYEHTNIIYAKAECDELCLARRGSLRLVRFTLTEQLRNGEPREFGR
jgi:hypothetical protein